MSYFQQYKSSKGNRMPPGVLNLIILNVIFFITKFLAASKNVDLDEKLALFFPLSPYFHWYQYITSLFMHADGMHIAMNMFGLWLFGHLLENAWGLRRFLIYYLICGVGASLIFQGWQAYEYYQAIHGASPEFIMQVGRDLSGPLLGASGAVFGLIMGAALLFPNTELPYMGFMGLPMKIKWIALLYGGGELYLSWQQNPDDHVAHLAHLGGMVFGFILVKIYSKSKRHFY